MRDGRRDVETRENPVSLLLSLGVDLPRVWKAPGRTLTTPRRVTRTGTLHPTSRGREWSGRRRTGVHGPGRLPDVPRPVRRRNEVVDLPLLLVPHVARLPPSGVDWGGTR